MAKQIAAVIQWTKDSISTNTRVIQTKFLSPDTQQGTLGRIGRHESKYGIDLKVFLESS
jgi:hypothetical protein